MCTTLKFVIFLLLFFSSLRLFSFTQDISIGPQCYYLLRQREGGSTQRGVLGGARISYERVKDFGFYIGLFCDYARGRINGHTGAFRPLASKFSDFEAQGLLGFTLTNNTLCPIRFIPFVGLGYLREINKFIPPSALTVRFLDNIEYASFGFLSTVKIFPNFEAGLRVTVKHMLEGRCKVSEDPESVDTNLIMANETQYAFDFPMTYSFSKNWRRYKMTFMPFIQFRHYGSRENYPYDFKETRFNVYGARLLLDICF